MIRTMVGVNRVEVIDSRGGCSKLFVGFSGRELFGQMSSVTSTVGSESISASDGPFSGLVICVTGLSKEARKQVMEATERLSGRYSPNLHPRCTHLIVQSYSGNKFEHALKHGARNGLFVVTLGWFVDSVRKNVRLSESLYSVKSVGERSMLVDEHNRLVGFGAPENSCLPRGIYEAKQMNTIDKPHKIIPTNDSNDSALSGHCVYIDPDISDDLRRKVVKAISSEGAKLLDRWFVGCSASYVVCEANRVQRYLGHTNSLVTPLWVLKTAKEKCTQRLVHLSPDLGRQVGITLENLQNCSTHQEINSGKVLHDSLKLQNMATCEERLEIVNFAKERVRNRRGRRMQTCQTPLRPITPSSLLDSICWTISEPTSTASVYTDSDSCEDVAVNQSSSFIDARIDAKDSDSSFANLTRPLKESEKAELIFKNHFLTILFPVDRFSEIGPSSQTYFSDKGFTCLQVLDYIYDFYQENMSANEIEAAIHTDSRHADRLRAVYSSKETGEVGYVIFKRIEFLGSWKSFEMLKRVSGDNNSNVYQLFIRA